MAVDIELACNMVQAKLATLAPTYLANVPVDMEHYFTALSDALCPYAFTWPSSGSWYQKGHGYKTDERQLTVYVLIESLNQKDMPTRTAQGVRALQAVRNLFITPSNIELSPASSGYQIVLESKQGTPQTDSGLRADLPFSGIPWFGFSIPLHVRILWQTS